MQYNHHHPGNSAAVGNGDNGWTLAICSSKRGGGRRRRNRHVFSNNYSSTMTNNRCTPDLDEWVDAFAVEGSRDDGHVQEAVALLATRMGRLERNMPHKFLNTILCLITRVLHNRPLALIRTFGIGKIEMDQCSGYQLVLLEAIRDHFEVPNVTCQDPVTTRGEKCYMEGRRITVLPSDNLLSTPLSDVHPTEYTLLYMIHCTPDMYNNALSFYSRTNRLQRLILIGNEPKATSSFFERCFAGDYDSSVFAPPPPPPAFPHLATFAHQSDTFPLPKFEPSERAFYNTVISFLPNETDENDDEDDD